MPKFEQIADADWGHVRSQSPAATDIFVRTDKHEDLHGMLFYISTHPTARLRTEPQASKKDLQRKFQTAHEYARRKGLKINAFCGIDMRLYLRMAVRPISETVQPKKAFQVTTAAEWRELQRRSAKVSV